MAKRSAALVRATQAVAGARKRATDLNKKGRTDRRGCRCIGNGTTTVKEVVVSCDVGWNQSLFDGIEGTFVRDRKVN